MKRLRWELAQAYARLDRVVAASALAIGLAVLVHYGTTVPWTAALQRERAAHAGSLGQARALRQEKERNDPALAAQAKVIGRLPPAGTAQVDGVLQRLEEAARAHQLEVDTGTYQLSVVAAGDVERYSISLPLKAGYPALRAFIRQALAQSPGLALASVNFSRASRGSPVVEARLEFTAYFRGQP